MTDVIFLVDDDDINTLSSNQSFKGNTLRAK